MTFKQNIDLKYLLLIPTLYLGIDFLPFWYVILYTVILSYIAFLKPFKVLTYINFISCYFIFKTIGMIIVPETMVPALGVFLTSRLLANKINNEFEMYPIFLWIGSFSIFSSSFYYLVYTCIALIVIFISQDSSGALSIKAVLKNIYQHKKQLSITLIITLILFIFFPRFYNFLPTSNLNTQGKIGYSSSINNSTTSNLLLSSQTAFFAELSIKISPELLYWRGRVHTQTDGYNWRSTTLAPKKLRPPTIGKRITQTIKYEQDFDGDIILLNTPIKVIDTNLSVYRIPITNEFRSYVKKKKSIVTAQSSFKVESNYKLKNVNRKQYLQIPGFIPSELNLFLADISGDSPFDIIKSFKRKLIRDQFKYTLSPGLIPTMQAFLNKKLGYCTHFSSLLGMILRLKGVPTRLVSGFQGGKYNDIGNFYEVKSNDAHAWVEYFEKGRWNLIDPTSFVSPERIRLGGEQFLNPATITVNENSKSKFFNTFTSVRQYFETINYKISLFLDNYDRSKQNELSKKLKLGLKLFFFLGFALIVIIFGIYYLILKKPVKKDIHPADKMLNSLDKKLKKKNIVLSTQITIQDMMIEAKKHPSSDQLVEFLALYQETRYGKKNHLLKMKLLKIAILS